ncbi:PTS sugar transporter subunit IIB [Clostridium sp. JN-9]|uniref:PTS system mannose/fructose/N-acetylgalactosamine-transporter subunit IIB n=1 Tax=Clostridium sp. JN-9 TaxID=2507159 RepID=UPI000FFE3271|nr:PTS sugar transporter subunit IIB [Clostridium sp. JN-9]QAT39147.1 PTS mannose/fructose/sorbose transporter subunit IIB [Clostridium sp. JN-9]
MLNIVLTRIDDRLIHGQVITAWSKVTKANRIIIVDDAVANDSFMVNVLKAAAPTSLKVEIFGTEEAVKVINGGTNNGDAERVIILVKTPKTITKLVSQGVAIKEVNLGGMGATQGRKQLYKNISASEEERQAFKDLMDKGIDVSIKIVPDAKQVSIKKLL